MGITELADNVAAKLDVTKVYGREVVEAVITEIQAATADGETIAIRGFGTFKNKTSAARKGRNIQTGAVIDIPAKTKLTFKAAPTK